MSATTEPADKRRTRRVTIAEHPQVRDAHSGEVIGELVNLSADGLMIAGTVYIGCNNVRQMRIPLRTGDEQIDILVGAESLWCEDANDSGIQWTGFQIIDISGEDQAILESVVGA